jgi:hypothetical protein
MCHECHRRKVIDKIPSKSSTREDPLGGKHKWEDIKIYLKYMVEHVGWIRLA